MSNVIQFEPTAQMPAHLIAYAGTSNNMQLNDAAEEFASVKFPVISVKNSRFSVKRDGETTMIMRPKTSKTDPDEPATYIDVAILNIQKAKTYYEDGYTAGSEDKPDCFSNDGITPDSSAIKKQCTTCALCPQNAWGTGTNDKGEATKGKACSDVQRVAVAGVNSMDDPMMLRVPPASLKNLAELSKMLSKKSVPLNGIVTRVSFDSDATGVVLTFKYVGWLDAGQFATAQAKMNDDLVLAIVGKKTRSFTPDPTPTLLQKEAPEKVAPEATPVIDMEAVKKAAAKAKKIAAAKALLAEAEGEDATPAPVATQPAAKATAVVASSSSFDDELAALLS